MSATLVKESRLETKASVVLYTKLNCHLCDEMKAELRKAGCDNLYRLEEVNIESDPALFERYRFDIPVLEINGIEAFRHRLQADQFRAALRASVEN